MSSTALSSARDNPWPLPWGTRTFVMAVVNLTPDSFSRDGLTDLGESLERIRNMSAAGADIVDLGGESTRPGATPVSADEEMARVLPVLDARGSSAGALLSIDTAKGAVAEASLARGVRIINDVSGLGDPDMAAVAAHAKAGLVIVHPDRVDSGQDVVSGVVRGLADRIERALAAGVEKDRIVVDPGLGFGKSWRLNLELVRRLGELRVLGFPILVGPSRKGTIGKVLGTPPADRLEGTAAMVTASIAGGADLVRVHDIRAMVKVARMTDALARG